MQSVNKEIQLNYYFDMVSAQKGDDDQTPWTPAINLAMGWAASLDNLKRNPE